MKALTGVEKGWRNSTMSMFFHINATTCLKNIASGVDGKSAVRRKMAEAIEIDCDDYDTS